MPLVTDASPSFRTRFAARVGAVLNWPGPRPGEDAQNYRVLVQSLFSSPSSILVSNASGVLVLLFFWFVSGHEVFGWLFLALLGVLVARASTFRRYLRSSGVVQTDRQIHRWDREYFFGATSFSLVVGGMCYAAVALTSNSACHTAAMVCATAFSSGIVARNAGRPLFVIIQLLFLCLPITVGLLVSAEPYYVFLASFVGLYMASNIAVVFSLNRNLLDLAAARKQSETLATSLSGKNVTLDLALNTMAHGLVMFDFDLRLEIANRRFAELYRLPADALRPGRPLTGFLDILIATGVVGPGAAWALGDSCRKALARRQPQAVELTTDKGETLLVSVEISPANGILMLTEDVTERKAAAAKIERMAHTDDLTGLASRFFFTEALRRACRASSGTRSPFAVFYIDLDNFKTVNDSLGHEAGDLLLSAVAGRLRALASPGELVGRFGGDEFLFLSLADTEADAVAAATAVVTAMAEPFEIGPTPMHVTTSVGIALVPEHGTDPSDVLRDADMALYSAKTAGRNTVRLFEPNLATELNRKRELEVDLRRAIDTDELTLHYQPIVNLKTGRPVSYEALMRWSHPTKGAIPPIVFIPIAEATGLIKDMGAWALLRACRDARGWPDGSSVAVNLSAVQFRDPAALVATVERALEISGLPPARLELEVTESLLIEDQEATLDAILAIRRMGVRFSLDDFGSGYSSLAYLARYPFSKVKIDREFARNVATDGRSRAIIEVVCQLAHRLGMNVVVEGIETEAQRREIEALGSEEAQGYLFGRPEPRPCATIRRDAA